MKKTRRPSQSKKNRIISLRDHRPIPKKKSQRVDIDPQSTSHHGIKGLYELALRRFKTLVYLMTIMPLYCLGGVFIGAALWPSIAFYNFISQKTELSNYQYFFKGLAIGVGWFLFGFSLILIVPFANFVMRTKPKTFRGPYYSIDFLQWFIHNALTYLVRYSFLEFITPTPFNLLFYRLMGMKIGNGTQINSTNISDPALIEMGKRVTIGGSATICAHYGQGGYLVLAPVYIGDNVTVGLKSSIMGGVSIGADAKILPHSIVLPKTIIGAGETWGGVPAQRMDLKKSRAA